MVELNTKTHEAGLKMNLNKSKVMHTDESNTNVRRIDIDIRKPNVKK